MAAFREVAGPRSGAQAGTGVLSLRGAALLVIVVAGLKLGADLFVPLLTATFLALVCVPIVGFLRRRGLHPTAAVVLTLVLVLALVLAVAVLVVDSLSEFASRIPDYQGRIERLWADARGWLEGQGIDLAPRRERHPVDPSVLLQAAGQAAGSAVTALTALLLVLLLAVFTLFEGIGLPGKLRRVLEAPDAALARARHVLAQVYSYLSVKTLISLLTGLLFGLWCLILGLDSWVLWGFLAFALNYIPNIGSLLAAIPPLLVALLQLGPGPAALTVAGNLVINQVLGNWVEPRMMGARLGLSPYVVFVSLFFWSWLWGPIGMLLSVPLTVVVKILLENSEDLRFIAALLGPAGEPDPVPPPR